MQKQNRRGFLKTGAMTAAGLGALSRNSQAFSSICSLTPAQTAGPFYPGENLFHTDHDLTQIPGHQQKALGQIIYLRGKVLDSYCRPLAGANVEIWQACASGKYNNSNDPNTAPLDANFKYWAEAITNTAGEYAFKTVVPGAYPADTDWIRPPHIHFKISKLGYHELVTQMYFQGNEFNEKDLILQKIPIVERQSVVVSFSASPIGFEPGSLTGYFDITLQTVR